MSYGKKGLKRLLEMIVERRVKRVVLAQKDRLLRFGAELVFYLTENYAGIAIEDLNVKGMLSNRRMARAISDMGFYEFRHQLHYKAQMRGNRLEVVDRWFASSKACSGCGVLKEELGLSERAFRCEACGFETDRDLNAAMNLFRTVSSTGPQACGEGGSGSSTLWRETVLCEAGTWP